jgi:hypothetical protein
MSAVRPLPAFGNFCDGFVREPDTEAKRARKLRDELWIPRVGFNTAQPPTVQIEQCMEMLKLLDECTAAVSRNDDVFATIKNCKLAWLSRLSGLVSNVHPSRLPACTSQPSASESRSAAFSNTPACDTVAQPATPSVPVTQA